MAKIKTSDNIKCRRDAEKLEFVYTESGDLRRYSLLEKSWADKYTE